MSKHGISSDDIGKAILIEPQTGWGQLIVGILVEVGATHHVLSHAASIWSWGKDYDTTKEEDEAMRAGYHDSLELRRFPRERTIEAAHLHCTVMLWDDKGFLASDK